MGFSWFGLLSYSYLRYNCEKYSIPDKCLKKAQVIIVCGLVCAIRCTVQNQYYFIRDREGSTPSIFEFPPLFSIFESSPAFFTTLIDLNMSHSRKHVIADTVLELTNSIYRTIP